MGQAFVKENDDNELLNNVQPTVIALMRYLRKQSNGRHIYRTRLLVDDKKREIHVMSNGLSYLLNDNNEWQMVF